MNDFDLVYLYEEKTFWLFRMFVYFSMFVVGFSLYAYFVVEEKKHTALLYLLQIKTFNYPVISDPQYAVKKSHYQKLLQYVLDNNTYVQQIVGSSYNHLSTLIKTCMLNVDNAGNRQKVSDFLGNFDLDNENNINEKLVKIREYEKIWILGAVGLLLFILGIYFFDPY